MALVLIEEILMGLEDAKLSLDEAVTTLDMLADDLHSDFATDLKPVLEQDYLRPLRARAAALEQLLAHLASETEPPL